MMISLQEISVRARGLARIKTRNKNKAVLATLKIEMSNYIKTFLICLVWAFYGCSSQKYLPSSNIKIIAKDSLYVHTELVGVAIPIENHSIVTPTKKSHLETSVAESDAEIDSLGMLHHTLTNKKDSLRTKIQYIDKIVYRDSIETKEVPVEVKVPVRYVPKFYQFTFILFWLFILFVIVKVIRKFRI